MDLLVIPLLLVTGVALTFLGINGLPESFQAPAMLQPALEAVRRPMLARVWVPRLVHSRPATITQVARPATTMLDDSDLLLNDVLSELMKVREELTDLRSRIETLTNAIPTAINESTPRRRARRPSAAETVSDE